MPLYMSLDCPHCMTPHAPFMVKYMNTLPLGIGSQLYRIETTGPCELCKSSCSAVYTVRSSRQPSLSESGGKLPDNFSINGASVLEIWFDAQHPEAPKPNLPDHLPDRLQRPYLEAEKAFNQGLWSLAAAGYRKAVDRAISPIVPPEFKGKMLGPKIGALEKQNILPEAMLEWIRLVKNDGNFALHDDDHDFDSKDQVQPAREFAHMLLTYLYTFPAKVRIARGLPDPEQAERE